ncbi:prepilin peptidase [bacterium]|nr:prepilin peptidase [bacterium]
MTAGSVLDLLPPAGTFTPPSLDADFLLFAGGAAFLGAMAGGDPERAVGAGLAGAALLAAVYAGVLWLGSRAFGRDAMGWGDVKMAAVVGMWLGPRDGLAAAAVAVVAGAAVGLSVLAWHRLAGRPARHLEIPFGPFIAVGALAAHLWSAPIVAAWSALRGLGAG